MNQPPTKAVQKQGATLNAPSALNPINDQPVVTVNYDEFAPLLEAPDLTEGQKRELLQALWNIVVAFIDFGFDTHPIQHALNDGGKLDKIDREQGFEGHNVLQSGHTKLYDTFTTQTHKKEAKGRCQKIWKQT